MTHMPIVISIGVMDTYSNACVRLVWSMPHTHNAKWKAKDMPETSMSRPFCSASTCSATPIFCQCVPPAVHLVRLDSPVMYQEEQITWC